MMERKLSRLFDRQKFEQNARLNSIISDVESRYAGALSDDDLELVSAAGDAIPVPPRDPGPEAEVLLVLPSDTGKEERP